MSESFGIPSSLSSLTTSSLTATSSVDSSAEGEAAKTSAPPPPPVSQPAQPPAASARTLAQRLDSLFIKVAQAATRAVSKKDLDSTVSKTSLSSAKIAALNQAVDEAYDTYKDLSQLTGRELATALKVDGKGRFDWDFSLYSYLVKDAVEAQANLASLLHEAASDPSVKGEEFENLSEMAAQADRRQMEIMTLAFQLADAVQKKADDPEVVKQLDAKLETLLPQQAFKINGNEAAIEKMKAQLQPLADRIDALASRPNASISSEELAALQLETATARNALELAAKEGFPTPDGGRWLPDKAFFTEAKKLIAEVEEKFSDTRKTIGLVSLKAFVKDAFAIPADCSIVDKSNLDRLKAWGFRSLEKAARIRHRIYDLTMEYLKEVLEKKPDSETDGRIDKISDELVDLADFYSELDEEALLKDIKTLKKMPYPGMEPEGWEKLQAIFKVPRGIMSQITHLAICKCQIFDELSPEQFLSTDSARALLDGKLVLSTIVEARIHGMTDADVNPKLDDSNLVSVEPLGHGAANTVWLLTYKDGSEFVFKPEAAGRQGIEGLRLSMDYEEEQQVAQLNLATQKTAEALGLEDVMPKSTVGCHDCRYGLFMEKAPGLTAGNLVARKETKDGTLTLDEIKSRSEEIYKKILGEVIRQTNRLEWMDLITGQGDRHRGNYMIGVRSDGTVTVKGIDNDECFPAYRTGLCSFHLTGDHAKTFRYFRKKIIELFPVNYQQEIKDRLEGDSGVVDHIHDNPPDDSLDIDATKFESGELHYALKKAVGLHGAVLPKFIDEDLYGRLQTLKIGNPAREAYLDELKMRLPTDAVASATTRLDQAIAHAELLKKNEMVFSQKDFLQKSKQLEILNQEFPKREVILGETKDGAKHLSSESDAVVNFRYQTHSLFGRDLARLLKKDWLSSAQNS